MPNYSSSKSAWPTFNLPNMDGGGVTRPQIRITKTKESTKLQVGPTRTAAADKARKDATMAYELRKAEARAAKKSGKRTAQEQADYDAVYAGTADAATQARFDKGAAKEAAAADKRAGSQDSAVVAEAKRVAARDAKAAKLAEQTAKKPSSNKTRGEYLKEVERRARLGIQDSDPELTAAVRKEIALEKISKKKPYIHKTKTSKRISVSKSAYDAYRAANENAGRKSVSKADYEAYQTDMYDGRQQ